MSAPAPTALQEWRRHWPLVLAAFWGFAFYSLMSPATGLFMAATAIETPFDP